MTHSILLRAFAPLPPTLTLSLPKDATTDTLLAHLAHSHSLHLPALATCRLSTLSGRRLLCTDPLFPSSANDDDASPHPHPITLQLRPLTLGGKGGFGSMLRAQGGKMSSKRGQENTDSCRDLSGRRLSTMKQAQNLAAYLESKPERERELDERQKRKFEKLERMLGRRPRDLGEIEEAARRLEESGDGFEEEEGEEGENPSLASEEDKGEGSSRRPIGQPKISSSTSTTTTAKPSSAGAGAGAGGSAKRERIEDHTFVEESREIVENVRNAVAAAMMKKKRKLNNKKGGPSGSAVGSKERVISGGKVGKDRETGGEGLRA